MKSIQLAVVASLALSLPGCSKAGNGESTDADQATSTGGEQAVAPAPVPSTIPAADPTAMPTPAAPDPAPSKEIQTKTTTSE